jgi:hypothetical protein
LLFLNTRQWAHLPDEPAYDGAIDVLAEASRLFGEVGDGGEALCRRLEELIALEDRLEEELGRVLAMIGHGRGWSKLGFARWNITRSRDWGRVGRRQGIGRGFIGRCGAIRFRSRRTRRGGLDPRPRQEEGEEVGDGIDRS